MQFIGLEIGMYIVHVTTLVTKRQTKTCGLYDDDSGPKSCDSTVNSQSLLNLKKRMLLSIFSTARIFMLY